MPPIEYAKNENHYVITVDFKPDNPGHAVADEYHNLSTRDHEGVLHLAREKRIDGIVAYASDPAAPTAAFVAEELGLPGNPYEAVSTLADKKKFRDFLQAHGFNSPKCEVFSDVREAGAFLSEIPGDAFVKPADSSGSKGVTRLKERTAFAEAFFQAAEFSPTERVVIEEEIPRSGYQIDADAFVVDGDLRFCCWSNQHVDANCSGNVPAGISFPSTLTAQKQAHAEKETQRLLDAIGFRNGALNIELVFTDTGELYFLEVGPRNGGNLIPEVTRYATGVDMIKYTVDAALGRDCSDLENRPVSGFWSSYIIHSRRPGRFRELRVSSLLEEKIVEWDPWVAAGDRVNAFQGAHHTLGTSILRFSDMEEMLSLMDDMESHIEVCTD
ncbi:ATP-grasp domain-containing protein [Thiohalorhabdus methylotrophus]|uniref:ATP-grasp domain-containing protein n=1 Tax=Thiohalorhabdus methylotrophus TaxID=3242694 RepID=A0ABV4TXC1_9GAMM